MSRYKRYLDVDVLTAAKQRLNHIFDTHDSVAVMFSGGKDSLATLHLTWEVAQERGMSQVAAVFRDEELIPDPVLDTVNHYRTEVPWCRLIYYAVPLASHKFILGKVIPYVQWDPGRPHLREVPPWAVTLAPGDTRVFDQYNFDGYAAAEFAGKVAFLTGIRAQESLMRYRASVNKLNDSYINASSDKRVSLCKPIYDWLEDDVFKFFMERDIHFCDLYQAQHLAGVNLRVSTPLHAEAAKRFGALREWAPTFYQQVVELFPEILVQERYWAEFDQTKARERYAQDFDGVRAYILEHIDDEKTQHAALTRLEGIEKRERVRPGSYPPDYVLNYFMAGSFKRELIAKWRPEEERVVLDGAR